MISCFFYRRTFKLGKWISWRNSSTILRLIIWPKTSSVSCVHRWSHGNHDWIRTFVRRRNKTAPKNLAKIDCQRSPNVLWETKQKKKKINFWEYLESVSGFWILRTLFSGEEEHAQKVFLLLNTERHGFPVAILHQGHVKRSVQCRRYQRSLSYQWSEQQQCCSW